MTRGLLVLGCLGCLGAWAGAVGCGVGGGEGEVTSPRLYVERCAVRAFDLDPHFFAAQASGDDLMIRIQRSDRNSEAADGLAMVVRGVSTIVGEPSAAGGAGGAPADQLGQALEVGMPPGVWPPGIPVVYDPTPPPVSMTLYLNDSCDEQNSALHSVSGTITFSALFNGDVTALSAETRLIEGEFDAAFTDPRSLVPGQAPDQGTTSQVHGSFRFYYERGLPAQPFP